MSLTVCIYHPHKPFCVSEDLSVLKERDAQSMVWVDVETKDPVLLERIAAEFGLHELTIEDCLSPGHFPKLEEFGNYTLLLFRGLKPDLHVEKDEDEEGEEEGGEQSPGRPLTQKIAICLGENFAVTYRRQEVTWMDAILRQVKGEPEAFLARGLWGLVHRVVDVLIDRFTRTLGTFERAIDEMEEAAIEVSGTFEMSDALVLKRKLIALRQIMRDQRAIILRLANDAALVRAAQLRRYFKDVDDHSIEIINILDKQIDSATSLRDAYFAMVNVRLSDTMRILTVLTTIVAPLNLLVGFYGMNFEHIPLLHSQSGFWVVVAAMVVLVLLMLVYFRRKRWI